VNRLDMLLVMSASAETPVNQGQRRANFQRARSQETRRSLVHSAVALWRVRGVDDTTVAEICKAAGVSKGLFYFYFERKEDILFELGMSSVDTVSRRIHEMLTDDYDVLEVIHESLVAMERAMRPNPPDLMARAVLEGYRRRVQLEQIDHGGRPMATTLAELFRRAIGDGKLPAAFDVEQVANIAQILISEGARLWPGWTDGRSFADIVTAQIGLVVNGAVALDGSPDRDRHPKAT
jgi:AcrR family transcriptional regulator